MTVQHELSLPHVEPEIFTSLARELGFVPDHARRPAVALSTAAAPTALTAPLPPAMPSVVPSGSSVPVASGPVTVEVADAFEAYRESWHAVDADETAAVVPTAGPAWTAVEEGAVAPPLPAFALPDVVDEVDDVRESVVPVLTVVPPAPVAAPATPATPTPGTAVPARATVAPAAAASSRRALPSLPPIARGDG